MKKLLFIPIVICLCAGQSFAADKEGTIVSLSASATFEVPNDEVVINFRVEERGKRLDALRQRVNQASANIKESLAKEKGVKLKTSSRSVNPIWKPNQYNRVRDGWVVVQTGTITSKHLDEVPRWLNAIEKAGAKLQGLSFRISDTLRRAIQERLRIQAVLAFKDKAKTMANALDAEYFHILHLNTGNNYSPPPMYRGEMAMMSKSRDVAPALSSGDSRITVNVNGDIELERKRFLVH